MAQIPAIDANRVISPKSATYNGVKIVVNNPRVNASENCCENNCSNNGTYNGVAIQVNRPSVETGHSKHHHNCIYNYPCAECAVTSDKVLANRVNNPATYQTTNFINNRTVINADVEFENKIQKEKSPKETKSEISIKKETVTVPSPNLTTTEAEKNKVNFHGLNFKAEPNNKIEIVPGVEIKPDVDIPNVLSNLSSPNYDVQAQQMEEIARVSMKDVQKAVPYIVTEVFTELENIVNKDTSKLEPPTKNQIEIRKQIIINEIVKEQSKAKNISEDKIELPYQITEANIKEASRLSTMEQAERNKEYALYTMAVLAKAYTDEVHRHTGNVVPLTDLAGISTIVETLKNDKNPSVKIASIDALKYIHRPEYTNEISSILDISANDPNPYVSRNATIALNGIQKTV